MNTTLAYHFARNTWTRERGYPSIKTNIQISIWYNEDRVERNYSIKFLLSRLPIPRKKKERGRDPSISYLKSETLTLQSRNISFEDERSITADEISQRATFVSHSWKMGSYVLVIHGDKVSSVFPGSSKEVFTIHRTGRQLRANLSIYPSTKLSLGYQSFRWYIYISILLSLKPSHLSLSLYMRFFLSGGHVYLLDPVPRLYRRRYLFERRPGRRQPSGTSNEHFWVVWRERRARYRSWGSQLDEIRTITSFLPSLKEPWNWKGSLSPSVTEKKEGGCPFSPTIGEIKGARAVSRESGLYYEREYAYVRLVFYPRRISSTIYPKLLIYIISFKLFFKLIRNQAYLFIL